MMDGILLAQIQRDPRLLAYDMIVITSATIDSARFARHFAPARLTEWGGALPVVVAALPDSTPVVQVSDWTYPVQIGYCPLVPAAKSG